MRQTLDRARRRPEVQSEVELAKEADGKPLSEAGDLPSEVPRRFDQYVHNQIDGRAFPDGAARFAEGGLTSGMFREGLSPRFAEAQQQGLDDDATPGSDPPAAKLAWGRTLAFFDRALRA